MKNHNKQLSEEQRRVIEQVHMLGILEPQITSYKNSGKKSKEHTLVYTEPTISYPKLLEDILSALFGYVPSYELESDKKHKVTFINLKF